MISQLVSMSDPPQAGVRASSTPYRWYGQGRLAEEWRQGNVEIIPLPPFPCRGGALRSLDANFGS